jgi:PPP family 3-phenylpropionic acid transporter
MRGVRVAALPRFVLLYGALFAGFGAASPFLPSLLQERGLGPNGIAVALACGTAIRLLAGPAGCRLADRLGLRRQVLTVLTAGAAAVGLGYLLPGGFAMLLLVSVLHAAILAPMVPLADALAVEAVPKRYGWVRGAGSAAFILGSNAAGQAVAEFGLPSFVFLNAGLVALAALAALAVPDAIAEPAPPGRAGSPLALLRLPGFVRLMLVAALIQGSHAMHDGFEVLRWTAAGIGPATESILWSEGVLAEVVVFVLVGPPLLRRIGPRGAALLAAGAGMVRWGVTAVTASVPAMALVEPLHGLTFALLHLACMKMLADIVPPPLAATAQAAYATIAVGAMAALMTLASGPLYGQFGAGAFWAMAALCALAVPVAAGLRALAAERERTPLPLS